MAEKISFQTEKDQQGMRLDKYLIEKFKRRFSRTFIQNLAKKNFVLVNGLAKKPNYKLKTKENIEIIVPEPEETTDKPAKCVLDILYEDSHIIAVNKPAGMVVHPVSKYTSDGVKNPTLVNALLYHCSNLSSIAGQLKPGIVHRLDKETSGVILAAKSDFAHRNLAEQFKKRQIQKEYIALVEGNIKNKKGVINLPIGRLASRPDMMGISYVKGRNAYTKYEVLEIYPEYSLIKVSPKTGRTHQIRVHMAYLGHPVLGDSKYGKNHMINRQALHAFRIKFTHPVFGKEMELTAPVPEDIMALCDKKTIGKI